MTVENKNGTISGTFNGEIMTVEEAASMSRLCGRTIRKMCERGDIQAVKLCSRWLINRERFMQLIGLEA